MPPILVVEPEPTERAELRTALEAAGWDVVTVADADAARAEMTRGRPALVVLSTATAGAGALAASCCRAGGGPGVIALVRPGGSAEALSAADTTLAEPFGDDALRSTVGQVMPATAGPKPPAAGAGGGDSKLTSQDIFGDLVAEMETTAEALGDSLDQPPPREPRTGRAGAGGRPPSSLDDDLDSRLEQTLSGVFGDSRKGSRKRRPKPDLTGLDVDALLSDTLDGLDLGRRRRRPRPADAPKPPAPDPPAATPEPPQATPPPAPPGPPPETPRPSTEVRPPDEPAPTEAGETAPDEPWDLDDDDAILDESERAEDDPFVPAPRPANLDFDAALASLVPPGEDAPESPAPLADREPPPATSFLSSSHTPPGPPGPPAAGRPPADEQSTPAPPESPEPPEPPEPSPPAAPAGEDAPPSGEVPSGGVASGEGRPFGQYRLLDRIGVGGMAEVWKARMSGVEGFQKMVAIKKILPHLTDSTDFVEMFVDEAKLAAQLNHANIIHIYDLGKIGDDFYIAMEYVDGENLRSILNRSRERGRPFPPGLALYLASRLASALDHAHHKKNFEGEELGLVHRDVSPQNVLVSSDGDIKLCDFGIVKAASKSSHTRMGALKGKIQYMSPEQASGKSVDRRSDVFSLGALTFEMLTGRRLFTGDSEMEVLEAVRDCRVEAPSSLDPSIPADVDAVVMGALAQDPDDRFQSAGEIGRQLEEILLTYRPTPGQKELARFMASLFGDAPALPAEERTDGPQDPADAPGEPPPLPIPDDEPVSAAQVDDILAAAASDAPALSPAEAEGEPTFDPPPLVLDEEPAPTPADLDILAPPPEPPESSPTDTAEVPADVEALEPPPGAEPVPMEEGSGRGRGLLVAAILLLLVAGAVAAWYFLAGPGAAGPEVPGDVPLDGSDGIVAPAEPEAESPETTGPTVGAAADAANAEEPATTSPEAAEAGEPVDPEELERMAAEALAQRMAEREEELRRQFEEEERRLQRQIEDLEDDEPEPPPPEG